MELRVQHGVRREVLPLIRLRGIGRVRARRLFNNGIDSIEALRAAGPERVGNILGSGIAARIFEQLDGGGGEIEEPAETQSTLSRFG
jgi:helicase